MTKDKFSKEIKLTACSKCGATICADGSLCSYDCEDDDTPVEERKSYVLLTYELKKVEEIEK